MKTRFRKTRWVVLFLTAAIGLTLYLTRHEPIACLTLQDGTELRLEYVTYGTEHRVRAGNRIVAWAARINQRWLGFKVPPYEPEYSYVTEQPSALFWFTRYDPETGELVKDHGAGTLVELTDYDYFGVTFGYTRGENASPMPHFVRGTAFFDRRKPTISLTIIKYPEVLHMEVPNPVAGISYPVWQPEPLPQKRPAGKLEVVLRSFSAVSEKAPPGVMGRLVDAQFEVLRDGQPSEGLKLERWALLDATGNIGHEFAPPPFTEAAWMVRAQFVRTRHYPYAEDEGVTFSPVAMPAEWRYTLFAIPEREAKEGLQLAALVGRGLYVMRDTACESAGSAVSQEEADALALRLGEEGQWLINADAPMLVLISDSISKYAVERLLGLSGTSSFGKAHLPRAIYPDIFQTGPVRIHAGGQARGLEMDSSKRRAAIPLQPRNLECAVFALDRPGQPAPDAGAPVRIQIIPSIDREVVDFLVAPPKPPENGSVAK